MSGVIPTRQKSPPGEAEVEAEQFKLDQEKKAREKKLADMRLSMLRRRQGGSPGVQPEPNQQQTLG